MHHRPSSKTGLTCVCGWRPPNQLRWRQRRLSNEHLAYMADRSAIGRTAKELK